MYEYLLLLLVDIGNFVKGFLFVVGLLLTMLLIPFYIETQKFFKILLISGILLLFFSFLIPTSNVAKKLYHENSIMRIKNEHSPKH